MPPLSFRPTFSPKPVSSVSVTDRNRVTDRLFLSLRRSEVLSQRQSEVPLPSLYRNRDKMSIFLTPRHHTVRVPKGV